MSKVIRPQGIELMNYLNDGYPVCNECGALMDLKIDEKKDLYLYVCPGCGLEIDKNDYEYEDNDYEESGWTDEMKNLFGEEFLEDGCLECDLSYPECKVACKRFDD